MDRPYENFLIETIVAILENNIYDHIQDRWSTPRRGEIT